MKFIQMKEIFDEYGNDVGYNLCLENIICMNLTQQKEDLQINKLDTYCDIRTNKDEEYSNYVNHYLTRFIDKK